MSAFFIFVLGLVVSAFINIVTALFSRTKGIRLLPWLTLYLLIHGSLTLLDYFQAPMKLARRFPSSFMSYAIVAVIGAVVAMLYWRLALLAAAAIDKVTAPSATASRTASSIDDAELCARTTALATRMRVMYQRHRAEDQQLSAEHQAANNAVPDPRKEPHAEAIARFEKFSAKSSRQHEIHDDDLAASGIVPEAQFVLDELLKRLPDERAPEMSVHDRGALLFKGYGGDSLRDAANNLDRLAKKLCPPDS